MIGSGELSICEWIVTSSGLTRPWSEDALETPWNTGTNNLEQRAGRVSEPVTKRAPCDKGRGGRLFVPSGGGPATHVHATTVLLPLGLLYIYIYIYRGWGPSMRLGNSGSNSFMAAQNSIICNSGNNAFMAAQNSISVGGDCW